MTDRPPMGVEPRPLPAEQPTHLLGDPAGAWIEHGFMFALNGYVLHSRGYELVMVDGQIALRGDGGGLRDWNHIDPARVDGGFRRFEQALLSAQGANKRQHAPRRGVDRTGDVSDGGGYSPGFRQPFRSGG